MIAILLAAALGGAPHAAHAPVRAPSPAPAISQQAAILGNWHNPKNSVAVRTGACGDKLCGWIIRASDKAQAKVRKAGGPDLIGTALLRDYRFNGKGKWSGQVWVPDMGRAFGSTITMVDIDTLNVKGCLVGGFICKSQVWRRD